MRAGTIHPSVRRFINLMLVDLQFARAEASVKNPNIVAQFHRREDKTLDAQEFVCEVVMQHVREQRI